MSETVVTVLATANCGVGWCPGRCRRTHSNQRAAPRGFNPSDTSPSTGALKQTVFGNRCVGICLRFSGDIL
ncbi:hypothetical protein FA95DRAFT_994233 [Auriscalpium vulgare]|uniref:Uncharacterized protein n=1 Tax=Auriscalpium vulgare TaxID=40419 RepID=A0ACB8R6K2_9AGAM|nr:hypothetical protein FA95DRAFT_994233 [Auriscalpium vulgare]